MKIPDETIVAATKVLHELDLLVDNFKEQLGKVTKLNWLQHLNFDSNDCAMCKGKNTVHHIGYPIKSQRNAGWYVWVCVKCDKCWVD